MTARDTKQRILDVAEDLLQSRGFSAFSFHDIARELGIKAAAVHYHYPTKSDLGTALIDRYRERFQAWIDKRRASGAGPAALLSAYFAVPLGYLRDGNKVCPLGVLEAEYNAVSDAMRQATRILDEETRGFLAEVLAQGREEGVFRFDGPAEDKALAVTAALQGALQIARPAGRRAALAVVRQIRRDLGLRETGQETVNDTTNR